MTGSSPFSGKDDKNPGFKPVDQGNQHNVFFSPSPNRLVDLSPLPMTMDPKNKTGLTGLLPHVPNVLSAPAELGTVHQKTALWSPVERHGTDQFALQLIDHAPERFELDPLAPVRAIRSKPGDAEVTAVEVSRDSEVSTVAVMTCDVPRGRPEVKTSGGGTQEGEQVGGWGGSFKIQWLSTERVSFQKTRNIRNPWNRGREVKVSRDGTELEPGVGHMLIEQWASLAKRW